MKERDHGFPIPEQGKILILFCVRHFLLGCVFVLFYLKEKVKFASATEE